MFELVLTLCLLSADGETCMQDVSPKTAEIETCERVGNFLSVMIAYQLKERGLDGKLSWACRKREIAL